MRFQTPEQSSAHRRAVLVPVLVSIVLLVAGCGSSTDGDTAPAVAALPAAAEDSTSSDSTPAVSPEDVSEEDAEAAQLRFNQCMTDNGVDQGALFGGEQDNDGAVVIEGDAGAADFDAQFEAYEAALEECEPILEAVFGEFTLSPEQEAEQADAEARFNRCMADNGVPIEASGEGDGFAIGGPDSDPADIEAAIEACSGVFDSLNDSLGEGDSDQ